MLIEQAFHYLPEVLLGAYYPKQDYEGGIVASFALAVLQELNGRNAANPLSLLQCERPYREKPAYWTHYTATGKRRYLRSDLHVNLFPLRAGNERLAGLGWRHSNWLEAKYFRALHKTTGLPKKNTNASTHTGLLMADLYRLLALVPRSVSKKQGERPLGERRMFAGRYLLHVYTGDTEQHLSLAYQSGVKRAWLEALVTDGHHSVTGVSTALEPSTVVSVVGPDLRDLTFDFSCTTYSHRPRIGDKGMRYTCFLNRIDSFKLTLNGKHWGVNTDRVVESSDDNDKEVLASIAEFVGSRIGLKADAEESRPSSTQPDSEGEDFEDE